MTTLIASATFPGDLSAGLGNADTGQAFSNLVGTMRRVAGRAVQASNVRTIARLNAGSGGQDATVEADCGYGNAKGGYALYFRISDASNWWRLVVNATSYQYASGTHTETTCYYTDGNPPSTIQGSGPCPPRPGFFLDHSTTQSVPTYYTGYAWALVLQKCIAGAVTTVSSVNVSAPTHLKVVANGGTITTFCSTTNNAAVVQQATVTDTFNQTATDHGLGYGETSSYGNTDGLDNFSVSVANLPPNAPSLTIPANINLTQDLVVPVGFSDPNPGDSASFTALRVRRTNITPTPAWTVITKQSPDTNITVPAGTLTAGPYEAQAANRDALGYPVADADLAWSGSVFFTAGTPPPGPVFTDPTAGATIPTASYTFVVSVPSLDQLEWRVMGDLAGAADGTNVIAAGGVIDDTAARSFTATGLPNGQTVHAQARAIKGGLAGDWTTATNPVSYTPPAAPSGSLIVDQAGGTIAVQATNPTPTGTQPAVAYHHLYRRIGDTGDGIRLRDMSLGGPLQLVPGSTYVDKTVVSRTPYSYKLESVGTNGTTSLSGWFT